MFKNHTDNFKISQYLLVHHTKIWLTTSISNNLDNLHLFVERERIVFSKSVFKKFQLVNGSLPWILKDTKFNLQSFHNKQDYDKKNYNNKRKTKPRLRTTYVALYSTFT